MILHIAFVKDEIKYIKTHTISVSYFSKHFKNSRIKDVFITAKRFDEKEGKITAKQDNSFWTFVYKSGENLYSVGRIPFFKVSYYEDKLIKDIDLLNNFLKSSFELGNWS